MKPLKHLLILLLFGCNPDPAPQLTAPDIVPGDASVIVYGDTITALGAQNYEMFIRLADVQPAYLHAAWYVGESFCDTLSAMLHWHRTVADSCPGDTIEYEATLIDSCDLGLNGSYRLAYWAYSAADSNAAFEIDLRWWRFDPDAEEAQGRENYYVKHSHQRRDTL